MQAGLVPALNARCAPQVLNVPKGLGLAAVLNIDTFNEEDYLVMLTKNGLIKRTPLSAFTSVKANGIIAIKLKVKLSQHV